MGYTRNILHRFTELNKKGAETALIDASRRHLKLKNQRAPDVEKMPLEALVFGQAKASNELAERGIIISPAEYGVCAYGMIWRRCQSVSKRWKRERRPTRPITA